MDPHTAIGFEAGRLAQADVSSPMVCLSTAHPAKFAEAVERSGVDTEASLPHHLKDLMQREERYEVLDNSLQSVRQAINHAIG
jgi:threonine synthase